MVVQFFLLLLVMLKYHKFYYCKVVIYNYVLCWLYSMTKNVVFALFCSLYFVGFYSIGFSIKLVKNQA